jgi:WD40 repeat protein
MKSYPSISHLFFALVIVLLVACQPPSPTATPAPAKTEAATAPTSTSLPAAPTITLAPPTATSVPPTATRRPTVTPMPPTENLALTPTKAPAPTPTSAPLAATGSAPISPDNAARVELVRTINGHQDKVWNVAFSGDGAYIASSDQRGTIKVWDVALGQEAFAFSSQGEGMNNLTFSPDSRLLASAQTIWDVKSQQVLHTLDGRDYLNAAFSPDGVWLAVSGKHPIKLWDVASGQVARTFEAQADTVSFSIAFSPDGTMLANSEHDGLIRLLTTGHFLE